MSKKLRSVAVLSVLIMTFSAVQPTFAGSVEGTLAGAARGGGYGALAGTILGGIIGFCFGGPAGAAAGAEAGGWICGVGGTVAGGVEGYEMNPEQINKAREDFNDLHDGLEAMNDLFNKNPQNLQY